MTAKEDFSHKAFYFLRMLVESRGIAGNTGKSIQADAFL